MLCTKKRYVGYSYEDEAQAVPKFDAKGIETVRRDGCPAERKIVERCVRLLFGSNDLSAVKAYMLRQCDKIQAGRVPLNDYVFASEVRLGTYKSDETAPAGAQVARQRLQVDPHDKIEVGERVPYVVIAPYEKTQLRARALRPEAVLFGSGAAHTLGPLASMATPLDAKHYITKRILPALGRIFRILGVDPEQWYLAEGRRPRRAPLDRPLVSEAAASRAGTLLGHMHSAHCAVCDALSATLLCEACAADRGTALYLLASRRRTVESRLAAITAHCHACSGGEGGRVDCRSLDCAHLFTRLKLARQRAVAVQHAGFAEESW